MKFLLSTHIFHTSKSDRSSEPKRLKNWQNIFRPVHPSVAVLIFAVSIVISDVIVGFIRPTIFASIWWIILAIVLLIVAILIPRFPIIFLAAASAFLIVSYRAAPDFVAQEFFQGSNGRTVTIAGRVAKDPDVSTSEKLNITLTDLKISIKSDQSATDAEQNSPNSDQNATESTNFSPIAGRLFTQVSPDTDIQRSDTVIINGKLSDGFGTYAVSMFRPNLQGIERPEPGDVFLKIRNFFADKVRDYIPSPQNGLALGYLLGQKSGVDQTFQDTLRIVGLTHIIVASGAHLSTLTGFAKKAFKKISRFASLLAGLLLTIFFIGITGLSASMIRAGLVTGISLVLSYFGRQIHPLRLIVLVAAATLIYYPGYINDLAWLLSFASFTGILVLAPAISKFFYGKDRKPKFIADLLISSVAAALLCTPILLYFFGQTSLISIAANLLVLPTVSFAMGCTFMTGVAALVLPPLANVFGHITTLILDYQISVVNFFGEQKIFLIKIDPENPAVFALYIPLMIVFLIFACYSRYKLRLSRKILA